MKEAAHKIFIDRYLDWELVKNRLARYSNIGKFYKLNNLQVCSKKAPYYCHFLAWRLGTWQDDSIFEFFDSLLGNAIKLPNWGKERIKQECRFEEFWSLLWELQVMQMFLNRKAIVEWTNSGPDLKITMGSKAFFVECTVYRKSFGLQEFITELFQHIHPQIKIEHRLFNVFSLPKDNEIDAFLDELFRPFLDTSYLPGKLIQAQITSPVILHTPNKLDNFYLFIENETAKEHIDKPWGITGPPEDYLDIVIKEALNNKRKANNITSYKPNLLAVNLLLSRDYQTVTAIRNFPAPDLGTEFDGVFLVPCGINEIPSLNKGKIYFKDNKDFIN